MRLVDQRYVVRTVARDRRQRREDLGELGQRHVAERRHHDAFRLGRLAEAELDIVREQPPHAADPLLERHDLELELDLVLAVDARPDVDRLGLRHVVAAVLEDDLGIADREAVLVGDAPAHDEGVVVEVEAAGIEEQHLAHLGPLLRFRRVMVADAGLFGGALDQGGEFLEDVGRGEAVGLQDQLALQIAQLVAAASVGVVASCTARPATSAASILWCRLSCPLPDHTVSRAHRPVTPTSARRPCRRIRPCHRRSRRNSGRRRSTARGSRNP